MNSRITEYLPSSWFRRTASGQPEESDWQDALKQWAEPVEDFVSKHPAAALALAFAAGVSIAWWLKRR